MTENLSRNIAIGQMLSSRYKGLWFNEWQFISLSASNWTNADL